MWIYSHSMQVTIKAKSLCGLSVRSPRRLRPCVRGWAFVAVTVLTCTEVCDIDCGHPLSVHWAAPPTTAASLIHCSAQTSSDAMFIPLALKGLWCKCTCLHSKGLCWWWSSLLTRTRDRPWTISRHADSCFSASQLRRRFQLGTCNTPMFKNEHRHFCLVMPSCPSHWKVAKWCKDLWFETQCQYI